MALAKTTAQKPVHKAVKKITLDDVWATIHEIGVVHKRLEKAIEETQKAQAEREKTQAEREKKDQIQAKKSLEEMKKAVAETQKSVMETQRSIGGLGKTVGTIAENLLVPNLVEKFQKLGFSFQIMSPHRKIYNNDNTIYAEIDAFLENGKQAMAVEVKATCKRDDVDYHIERMGKIRHHADLHDDKRQFAGAIVATVIDEATRRYALQHGFYLIEPSGEDVKIIEPIVKKFW